MIQRIAKIALVAAVAFFYTLVVFNNLTDYASNYQLVHHVLLVLLQPEPSTSSADR